MTTPRTDIPEPDEVILAEQLPQDTDDSALSLAEAILPEMTTGEEGDIETMVPPSLIDDSLPETATPVVEEKPTRGRFGINVIANIANFAVGVLVGLWLAPFIIHRLGTAVYGMIGLAYQMTTYLSVLTTALNSAVARYLTISLTHDDDTEANQIFNTSLFGSLLVAAVLLGPGLWVAWHIERLIKTPPGYSLAQVHYMFTCTLVVFLMTTISTPFEVSSFCRNRFDLRNIVAIASTLVRIGVLVLLFTIMTPSLASVGTGLLAGAVVALIGVLILWRVLTPTLVIRLWAFSRAMLSRLLQTGIWVSIDNTGALLFLSIDLLVVNHLLGSDATGRYNALLQWSALLRTFAGVIAAVFTPTIFAYYARKDMPGLVTYARRAVKFLGLVMALPIALICGLAGPLLHVWLGHRFQTAALAPLLSLMTLHLSVNLAFMPLLSIQMATNNVRWPGVVTFLMGAGNLGLALLLAGPMHWGMYGVAAAGAIMLTAKNVFFTPLYAAHILRRPWWTFYNELLPHVIVTVCTAALGWGIASRLHINSWRMLIACGLLISVLYVLLIWVVRLTREERQMVLQLPVLRKVWQR